MVYSLNAYNCKACAKDDSKGVVKSIEITMVCLFLFEDVLKCFRGEVHKSKENGVFRVLFY